MGSTRKENTALVSIEKIICTIAEKEGYKDYRSEITTITTNGANFLGDLYLIDITEKTKGTFKLFAKAATSTETTRAFMPIYQVYETEVFMYTKMAETFDELQKMHAIPKEKLFKFPRYYGSSLKEMEELIVLENLEAQGYEVYSRLKPIDWDYAKAAVEEIAKFHALSFTLEKENPKLFAQLMKNRQNPMEVILMNVMESMKLNLPLALTVVEKDNYGKVQKFIAENSHKLLSSMFAASKHPVLTHGDYRTSNIMVKHQNGRVVSLKPIDYQTVNYNCPVIDLLYLLFTGSDEKFRQQYYEQYFLHYHDTLTKQLELLSQDVNEIYPRSAFYFDLKDKLILGLEMGLLMLSTILADTDEVLTIDEILEATTTSDTSPFKGSDAYKERINGVIRDYVRWGLLKEETSSETQKNNAPVDEDKSINDEHKPAIENINKI